MLQESAVAAVEDRMRCRQHCWCKRGRNWSLLDYYSPGRRSKHKSVTGMTSRRGGPEEMNKKLTRKGTGGRAEKGYSRLRDRRSASSCRRTEVIRTELCGCTHRPRSGSANISSPGIETAVRPMKVVHRVRIKGKKGWLRF
jgi:hypothetical protein